MPNNILRKVFNLLFIVSLFIVISVNIIYFFILSKLEIFDESIFPLLTVLLFLIEIISLFVLFIVSRRNKNRVEKIMKLSFSILFVLRYIIIVLIMPFIAMIRTINGLLVAFCAFLILFGFNIMPYLWAKKYYSKYLDLEQVIPLREINFEKIFKTYKISKREQDICKLILEGKNNKEIEDKLFISYNTVKNHVYNIFQKVGVSNRTQFINFLPPFWEVIGFYPTLPSKLNAKSF